MRRRSDRVLKPEGERSPRGSGREAARDPERPAASGGSLGAGDGLLRLQRTLGNRHVQRVVRAARAFARPTTGPPPALQTKLDLGSPDDRYEREADRVEEEVSREPRELGSSITDGAAGERTSGVRQAPPPVSQAARETIASATEGVIRSATGGGERLPAGVRGEMESQLGADFSAVRVHTDRRSEDLNRSLGARAFTIGTDIFFDRGEYRPGDRAGTGLLAHELTHVVQQGGHSGPMVQLKRSVRFALSTPQIFALQGTGVTIGGPGSLRKENTIDFQPLFELPDVEADARWSALQEVASRKIFPESFRMEVEKQYDAWLEAGPKIRTELGFVPLGARRVVALIPARKFIRSTAGRRELAVPSGGLVFHGSWKALKSQFEELDLSCEVSDVFAAVDLKKAPTPAEAYLKGVYHAASVEADFSDVIGGLIKEAADAAGLTEKLSEYVSGKLTDKLWQKLSKARESRVYSEGLNLRPGDHIVRISTTTSRLATRFRGRKKPDSDRWLIDGRQVFERLSGQRYEEYSVESDRIERFKRTIRSILEDGLVNTLAGELPHGDELRFGLEPQLANVQRELDDALGLG